MDLVERLLRPLRTGIVSSRYPAEAPLLQPAVRGLPELDPAKCTRDSACVAVCPTGAIVLADDDWQIDAGRCVFCGACERACPVEAIALGTNVILAATSDEGLIHVTALRPGGRG